jgi:DNA-binding response OmpR family regulator
MSGATTVEIFQVWCRSAAHAGIAGMDRLDYVNKPINVGELMVRMRTALRHRMQRNMETPVLRAGDLEIDAVDTGRSGQVLN